MSEQHRMPKHRKATVLAAALAVTFGACVGVAGADGVGAQGRQEARAATALGVDVSNYQGSVDWSKVKSDGRDFTFVLASDGSSFTNELFDEQYSGAGKAGLLRGAYHFARPSSSASKQAAHFLNVAKYKKSSSTLPPVVDMEADPEGGGCYGLSNAAMKDWIQTFVDKVKSATGRNAIIYTSPGFWSDCTGNSKQFTENPLWVAEWGVSKPSKMTWSTWTFWQYSATGSVPGIDGDVDVNRYNGTVAELKKYAAG